MLHQRATNRWALGKYALVMPLAFFLLAMTTAREEIATALTQATDETITISGRVTSADGKPLPGAHVLIAGSIRGTYTDAQGRYRLKNVPKSASLAYSFIGYRTDLLRLEGSVHEIRQGQLMLNPRLKSVPEELPAMGATAAYKAIKLNPAMPVRTPPTSETINGNVATSVEEPAVFPTGVIGIMRYVAQNLRYPAKARAAGIEGDVYVLFVVSPTGAVSGTKTNRNLKRVGGGCEEEAVRIVSQMPRWIPARQQGKPVAMRYMLPVRFALKKEDKRTGQVEPPTSTTFNAVVNNHPNARYGLYNDINPKAYSIADSLLRSTQSRQFTDAQAAYFSVDSNRKNTSTIRVRGRGPLGQLGEDPLYIVNDEETSAEIVKSMNPKTIESITVLKDASTRAYGEKGKNGVVLITTKKP